MEKKELVFLKSLIYRGYFPEELPPLFTTKYYAKIINTLVNNEEIFEKEPKHSKAIMFSIPKAKDIRRNLCIPNPLHQYLLSKVIVERWEELQTFYCRSTLSLTKPIKKDHSKRAISREYNFNEITRQRILKSTAARFLLRTDISRFYPTIYTHSISWALHGKNFAKNNINNRNLLGNVLDFYVRNTKEQQTLGIPIGPDTSLVISEILGTSIDDMIVEKIGNVNGFRYVDDIYLYFKELGDAEKAKYTIASIFSEFELEMNADKTKIVELHNEVEPEWISELRLHTFNQNSEKDVISYFSKVFKFAELYPCEQVIKYAAKRVSDIEINDDCWDIFESFLLKLVLKDPIALPIVLNILINNHPNKNLNMVTIQETMNYIIEYNTNYNNTYEILWAMWIIYWFDLKVTSHNIKKISKVDDPLVALMALFLIECNFIDKNTIDLSIWKEHMKSDELYTNYWILSYEAYIRGWLPSKSGKDYIISKKYFDFLRRKNVRFTFDKDTFESSEADKHINNDIDDSKYSYY